MVFEVDGSAVVSFRPKDRNHFTKGTYFSFGFVTFLNDSRYRLHKQFFIGPSIHHKFLEQFSRNQGKVASVFDKSIDFDAITFKSLVECMEMCFCSDDDAAIPAVFPTADKPGQCIYEYRITFVDLYNVIARRYFAPEDVGFYMFPNIRTFHHFSFHFLRVRYICSFESKFYNLRCYAVSIGNDFYPDPDLTGSPAHFFLARLSGDD